jgi:hypothetical protein
MRVPSGSVKPLKSCFLGSCGLISCRHQHMLMNLNQLHIRDAELPWTSINFQSWINVDKLYCKHQSEFKLLWDDFPRYSDVTGCRLSARLFHHPLSLRTTSAILPSPKGVAWCSVGGRPLSQGLGLWKGHIIPMYGVSVGDPQVTMVVSLLRFGGTPMT